MKKYFLFALLSILILLSNVSHAEETRTPIKHVIIIIEENHSFDNLFGTYRLSLHLHFNHFMFNHDLV